MSGFATQLSTPLSLPPESLFGLLTDGSSGQSQLVVSLRRPFTRTLNSFLLTLFSLNRPGLTELLWRRLRFLPRGAYVLHTPSGQSIVFVSFKVCPENSTQPSRMRTASVLAKLCGGQLEQWQPSTPTPSRQNGLTTGGDPE